MPIVYDLDTGGRRGTRRVVRPVLESPLLESPRQRTSRPEAPGCGFTPNLESPRRRKTVQIRVHRRVGARARWSIRGRLRAASWRRAIQRPSGGGPSRMHAPAPPTRTRRRYLYGIARRGTSWPKAV
jgi:hypothetical protein